MLKEDYLVRFTLTLSMLEGFILDREVGIKAWAVEQYTSSISTMP